MTTERRSFRVWRSGNTGRWYWCCTLCDPYASGSRRTWEAVIGISMPGHFCRRKYHHAYVRRTAA